MAKRSPDHAERPSFWALVVFGVAILAVMATSSDNSRSSAPVELTFTLSAEEPSIAFRSAATYDGSPRGDIRTELDWVAVSTASNPDPDAGLRFESSGERDSCCSGGVNLIGPNHVLTFALSNAARNGPVSVTLTVAGWVDDAEEGPPFELTVVEDATIAVSAPPIFRREVQEFATPFPNWERLTLTFDAASEPGATVSARMRPLESSDAASSGISPFVLLDHQSEEVALEPSKPMAIELPSECAVGPCSFDVQLLTLPSWEMGSDWQFDLASEGASFDVATAPLDPAWTSTTVQLGPISLPGDEAVFSRLILEVPEIASPLFHVNIDVSTTISGPAAEDDSAGFDVLVLQGNTVATTSSASDGQAPGSFVTQSLVPVAPGQNEFVLEARRFGREDDDLTGSAEITVTLFTLFPLPEGADLTARVES